MKYAILFRDQAEGRKKALYETLFRQNVDHCLAVHKTRFIMLLIIV